MSLLGFINDFLSFVTVMFNTKTDYASYVISDATGVYLTVLYYKIQYLVDQSYYLLNLIYSSIFWSVSSPSFNALIVALKFLSLIALLIFIRGGIPRYRFDHLTKVG
jgi:NADH:ubiquinone oxidoreductase subunit H